MPSWQKQQPEAGARAVSAVASRHSPGRQPQLPRAEGGRGGRVEDATPDGRERKENGPPPPLNGAFGATD